jgi:hypothetical protein
MSHIVEAQNWLDLARKEQSALVILESLSKLENILYQKKIPFDDIKTSREEIRRLRVNAYKKECLHWLLVTKKKNSFYAIQKFEALRVAAGLTYAEAGTSKFEITIRKIIAKINKTMNRKKLTPTYF